MEREYHIVSINDKTGRRVCMTRYPMSHRECMINISKITTYPWRRLILVESHPKENAS